MFIDCEDCVMVTRATSVVVDEDVLTATGVVTVTGIPAGLCDDCGSITLRVEVELELREVIAELQRSAVRGEVAFRDRPRPDVSPASPEAGLDDRAA